MPRLARKKSESNIYHVMLRGINRQVIFQDNGDCEKYLQCLEVCKTISGFTLHAYCLMGNHLHLLIESEGRLNDHEAIALTKQTCKLKHVTDFVLLPAEQQTKYINKLHEQRCSIRQLARLTGLSKGQVERMMG